MEIAYSDVLRTIEGRPCPRQAILAPYRLETRNRDLIASLPSAFRINALSRLQDSIRNLADRQHVFFVPSCRFAIAQILSLLPHREVVMPAYTCPVVRTAVEVSGKHIIYVDIAHDNINASAAEFSEHAKPGRVLLPTHIFGIPTDIEAICNLARARGCVIIEDAAASFGSIRNGQLLGTFGDFGVFSFERSKRLPAFRGGVIVVNNDQIFNPSKLAENSVLKAEKVMPFREMVFAMLHNAATIPWLYGWLTLPKLLRRYSMGEQLLAADEKEEAKKSYFYTRDFHPYQAALVLRMLARFDSIRNHISKLVSIYVDAFTGTSIKVFLLPNGDSAGLLRFPIAFPGKIRSDVLRLALSRGLYLETNYERPLPKESEYANFPNSVWAAQNLVLLPLHTRLLPRDAERLAGKIIEINKDLES